MKKSNKNKRNGLIILVIALILIVGIGYAATSQDLLINGTAAADEGTVELEWDDTADFGCVATGTNKKFDATKVTMTPAIDSTDKTKATLSVSGLKYKNDTVTCTYTAKNVSEDFDATLPSTCTVTYGTGTNDNFTVTATPADTDAFGPNSSTSTKAVSVVVKLSKAAKTALTDKTFTITCTGTAA